MIIKEREIEYQYPGQVINILAYGDIHNGARGCEKGRITSKWQKWGRKRNTYFIDMGDACDCIVSSDKKRFRPSCVEPNLLAGDTVREDWIDQEINWYCNNVKKHINLSHHLGIVSGNHHDKILKYHNTDPTERIANRLGIPNLGYSFYYHLIFKLKDSKERHTVVVYGHHGKGAITSFGGAVTKFCKDASLKDADLCLYGHTHQLWQMRIVRPIIVGKKLQERPITVVNTGGFLKSYLDSTMPSYPEEKMYHALPLGAPVIHITLPKEGSRTRITASL